jgi:hypothetical protein
VQGTSEVDHSEGRSTSPHMTRLSARHTSAYVHIHSKQETSVEREGERPGSKQRRGERGRERSRGRNEDGWGSCNRRSGIEEGNLGGSYNLHTKSVDPKRKALQEVPGSVHCIVPDRLRDYRAKRGYMQHSQSWVHAVAQQSLGLEVVPFSEIVSRRRCSESSSAGQVLRQERGKVEDKDRMGGLVCTWWVAR